MKKNLHTLIISIGLLFIIVSCTDTYNNFEKYETNSTKLVLTPEEFVSIAYDDPKELSEKEITEIIIDFQNISSEFSHKKETKGIEHPQVSIINKYYLTNPTTTESTKQGMTRSGDTKTISIPIFEVELPINDNDKDFAIICGDERAPKVLFYANNYNFPDNKTNFEMRYLMELAKRSALSDINTIEKIKSEKRNSTLTKVSKELNIPKEQITKEIIKERITTTDDIATKGYNPIGGVSTGELTRIISMVGPLSRIGWTQNFPYNTQMPIGKIWDGHSTYTGNIDVGCANVCVATLFSILKPAIVGVTATGRQILIDWDYITSKDHLYIGSDPNNSSPAKMVEMAGSLLRAVYNETKSKPVTGLRDGYDEDLNPIKVEAIVSTETITQNMLDYLQTIVNYSEIRKFNPDLAKQSLQEMKPVLLYGNGHFANDKHEIIKEEPYDKEPGHAWLIDGYCMTKKSGQATNDLYWSVNMGWGIFSYKVYFKTENNNMDCDVIFPFDANMNIIYYTQEQNMLYNISKK